MDINKIFRTISRAFFVIVLLVVTACGGGSTNVTINGSIEGAQNKLVLLRETSHDKIATIDSIRTNKNGHFEFSIPIATPTFLLLQVEKEVEPIVLLVMPNEEIEILAKSGSVGQNYSVKGSKGSMLVRDLNYRLNNVVGTIDSLSRHFRENREHPKFDSIKLAIDSAYLKTLDVHRQYTINFIKENRYNLAAVLALYQQYDKTRQVLNKREDFELFQMVDESLFSLYPQNPLVVNLNANVKKMRKQLELYDRREDMLYEGDRIPNINFPTIDRGELKLTDIRGRYFLIDFWAMWCNDCVSVNNQLKPLHEKFAPKGFQIIQISLDEKQESLMQFVERDSIPWIVVSDYLAWDSPILDTLSINSIPSNYLIDRNGVVKARNISINELDELLKKLLP